MLTVVLLVQIATAPFTSNSCKHVRLHTEQPAGRQYLGQAHSLNGLSDAANLIDLQQQGGARLLLNGALDADWVGAQQVIANHLHSIITSSLPPQPLKRLYVDDGAAHVLIKEALHTRHALADLHIVVAVLVAA